MTKENDADVFSPLQKVTLDFIRINTLKDSRKNSFEEIGRQLFTLVIKRRSVIPRHTHIIPSESYSDCGVGALAVFFTSNMEHTIGMQAKYLFEINSAALRQMENSPETAISN